MATWSRSGEGERLWFLGTLATIRVAGEAVDGRFALIEFLFPQHASPPLHTHPQDESYVVLDGQLTVESGGDRFTLTAGAVAGGESGKSETTKFPCSARFLRGSLSAARYVRRGDARIVEQYRLAA